MIKPTKIHDKTRKNKQRSVNKAEPLALENVRLQVELVETAPADNQQIIRGPKERFSGNLHYNLTRLGERLSGAGFFMEQFLVGSVAAKQVVLAYLQERANPGIVAEVRERIGAIRAETILNSSYIERNIEDSSLSPFPQVETTQRPDVAESALFQGRVAVLVEGSPDVLLAPATFFDLIDTPDDAYGRWFVAGSFFRIARYIMFILAASVRESAWPGIDTITVTELPGFHVERFELWLTMPGC